MKKYNMEDLLDVMQQLRDPVNGCIWDKEQTYKSILPHTIEEVYEVVEAIETNRLDELAGELGDLLFQIIFYSQIAKEDALFDFNDVTHLITEKMIRRHPHVFSDYKIETVEEQSKLWDEIKQQERKEIQQETSALDGVNKHQPAINIANRLQKKAAKVGFDWQTIDGPFDKINEEIEEVREAIDSGDIASIKDEIGDLFFAVINLSRHLDIDPDEAITSTNLKFEHRFRDMEKIAHNKKKIFSNLSLEEQEELWIKVKQQHRE